MNSFIITSKDKNKKLEHAKAYCQQLNIDTFDITIIDKESNTKQESIGIEDIKNIQKKIFLKPLKSQTKAIIIDDSHLLTIEAQNALLKVLEEPPNHTIIMLLAESRENLLPTIISRCKVVELEEERIQFSEDELKEYEGFIKSIPALTIGERLKKAEILAKDKEKGIAWIAGLILVLREKLIKAPDTLDTPDTLHTLRALIQLSALLKSTNVNPRMAIENTLLSIIK